MITATTGKETICPKCGATFPCDPTDCWCFKLPNVLPAEGAAQCYCPKCLEEMIIAQRALP